jgi:hypothetical protein
MDGGDWQRGWSAAEWLGSGRQIHARRLSPRSLRDTHMRWRLVHQGGGHISTIDLTLDVRRAPSRWHATSPLRRDWTE